MGNNDSDGKKEQMECL